MSNQTSIPFGIVAGDGKNYTVEVVSVETKQTHTYERKRRYRPCLYHDRFKTCCWESSTVSMHKIKIISRYSYSFVKSLGIAKPNNHRNHATITRSGILVHWTADINRVIAYVNVMEDQIKKDVQTSRLTKQLVKRKASEIFDLKHDKYPDMNANIQLNDPSGDDELMDEEQELKEPSSPELFTARYKKKFK